MPPLPGCIKLISISILLLGILVHSSLAVQITTATPFYAWSTSSSGWTGVGFKSARTAIFLASDPTSGNQSLTIFSNGSAIPAQHGSFQMSATPAIPFDSRDFVHFIGGPYRIVDSIYANGSVAASWDINATIYGVSPAAANFNSTPRVVFFAGGIWPGGYQGAPFARVSVTGFFNIGVSNPCATDTLSPHFAAGYFSQGVSTNQTLLFTKGCNSDLDFLAAGSYSAKCLNNYGRDDVLLFRPEGPTACPIIYNGAVNAFSFNLSTPRARVGVGVSTKYLIFAGGEHADGSVSRLIEVYNVSAIDNSVVSANTPPPVAFYFNLSSARRSPKVVVVSDRYFFFLGGDNSTGAKDSVDILDTEDFTMNTTQLKYPATQLAAAEDPKVADSVLYIGGYEKSGSPTSDVHNVMYRITAVPSPAAVTSPPPASTTASTTPTSTASTTPTATSVTPTATSTSTSSSSPTQPSSSSASPSAQVTTTPPPTPPPTAPEGCILPPPPVPNVSCVNGVWIINGSTSVSSINVTSPIFVNGTLNITTIETVVRIQPIPGQVPITVKDDASIRGVIELHVTSLTEANVTILVAGNVTGSFSGVTVISDDGKTCKRGTLETSQSRVGVLISDCKKKIKWWIPFLIVVACLLLVLCVIVLGVIAMRKGWGKSAYRSRVNTQKLGGGGGTQNSSYRLLGEEKRS